MKTVVVIAPNFIPSSYPNSLRAKFFVNHLKKYGWNPIVLTINPNDYEWPVDEKMYELLNPDIEVIRVRAISSKFSRFFSFGDISLRSIVPLNRAVKKLIQRTKVDLLFFPLPPFYTTLIGRSIYKKHNIPYIMDYTDPWVSDYWKGEPGAGRISKRGIADLLSRYLEPKLIKHVSHLIGVSKGTTDEIIDRYDWINENYATEIPLGGEAKDFDYIKQNRPKNTLFNSKDGKIHIAYVGRGGHDMVPALEVIFAALLLLQKTHNYLFTKLKFHFIGTTYARPEDAKPTIYPIAEKLGLGDIVEEFPSRISYIDALNILTEADVLIVPGSHAGHYTASKIYPYILAKRPLLAVFNAKSSVVKVMNETNAGHVITFEEVSQLNSKVALIHDKILYILEHLEDWTCETNWDNFRKYTTDAMTQKLSKVFDRVVEKTGS